MTTTPAPAPVATPAPLSYADVMRREWLAANVMQSYAARAVAQWLTGTSVNVERALGWAARALNAEWTICHTYADLSPECAARCVALLEDMHDLRRLESGISWQIV